MPSVAKCQACSIPREISLETAGHEGRERGPVIGLLIDMKPVEEVEAHAVKDAAKVVAGGQNALSSSRTFQKRAPRLRISTLAKIRINLRHRNPASPRLSL